MNELFLSLGIESWKPAITGLLLPPLPLLLLILVGARLMFRNRLVAWSLVLAGVGGIWLTCTPAVAGLLTRHLLHPPQAISEATIAQLRRAPHTTIVVLGAGRRRLAPEYGVSTLKSASVERLRYGLWLSRQTELPVGFSGGVGLGAEPGPTEADVAARIAEREFGRPLRWTEGTSRDTRENALRTIALLQPMGIERIVLVTQGYHMKRALRNFEHAARGTSIQFVVAPMSLWVDAPLRAVDWLPTASGLEDTWLALHEWLGLVMGA